MSLPTPPAPHQDWFSSEISLSQWQKNEAETPRKIIVAGEEGDSSESKAQFGEPRNHGFLVIDKENPSPSATSNSKTQPGTGEAGSRMSGCDPRDQMEKIEDQALSHGLG